MAALAATLLAPAVLQAQNVTSILQVLDTKTGETRVVREFPYLIEAPNWTIDGNWLIFNSQGQIWKIAPNGGDPEKIDTGEVMGCNNDHVLSFDGRQIAVSAQTASLRRSRIFLLPAARPASSPRILPVTCMDGARTARRSATARSATANTMSTPFPPPVARRPA